MTPFLTFKEIRLARGMEALQVAKHLSINEDLFLEYERNSKEMPYDVAKELGVLYRIPSLHYINIS